MPPGADLEEVGARVRDQEQTARPSANRPHPGADTRKEDKDKTARRPSRSPRAPMPDPKPIIVWPKKHVIVSGDTLAAIAQRYYGSAALVQHLLTANPRITDPRRLKIGDVINIPKPPAGAAVNVSKAHAGSTTGARQPQRAAAGRTYRVREGDSFYSIAEAIYGDGARWQDIFRLNRALVKNDPRKLRPDMILKLPE
jgi:nucleoid-associated protein YgaU